MNNALHVDPGMSAAAFLQTAMTGYPMVGYGTSRLAHRGSIRSGIECLAAAMEQGIRYFDTAPVYGYGWSEKIVGRYFSGQRHQVIIVTKVGLTPPGILRRIPLAGQTLLRQAAKHIPGSPPAQVLPQVPSVDFFHQGKALKSVDSSLRRLRTDYVDFLLLHEVTPDIARAEEVLAFCESVLTSGRARFVGIGSARERLGQIESFPSRYRMFQHEVSIRPSGNEIWQDGRIVNIHGVHRLADRLQKSLNSKQLADTIRQYAGLDLSDESAIWNLCWSMAAHQTHDGVVLIASSQPVHIQRSIKEWSARSIDRDTCQAISSRLQV